ncbi:hypothetical protein [Paracoccus yeei]|uniref:hypothetical protein n=1 Tax=Paracoccus yeei TaxID=147645 RepID=UPI0020C48CA8|nr:hypothetical protein [Paracoccus yeei]
MTPAEIKEKFPLIEESMVQGGLWNPDAGLVVPRSQTVAGLLVENAEKTGRLRAFANTPALELVIEDGHIRGVVTPRGRSAPISSSSAPASGGPDGGDGGRGSAGDAHRPPAGLFRLPYRVRRHRQGHQMAPAARPGQLGLYARHRRSDHR